MGFEVPAEDALTRKGNDAYELSVGVGTKGLGKGAFVHLCYTNNAIPENVHPTAVLEFPNKTPGGRRFASVRCCMSAVEATDFTTPCVSREQPGRGASKSHSRSMIGRRVRSRRQHSSFQSLHRRANQRNNRRYTCDRCLFNRNTYELCSYVFRLACLYNHRGRGGRRSLVSQRIRS